MMVIIEQTDKVGIKLPTKRLAAATTAATVDSNFLQEM